MSRVARQGEGRRATSWFKAGPHPAALRAASLSRRERARDTMKHLDRSHILTRIIEAKANRLQVAKMRVPEPIVKRMAETAKAVPSFKDALEQPQRLRIIAEVKKASPSKGVLKADLDPAKQASAYREAGASAISVVTEEDFFQGDLGWVGKISEA